MIMAKIMFISSMGGHLSELLQLDKLILKNNSYVVTEKSNSTLFLKEKYKNVFYLISGSKDYQKFLYPFRLLGNCFKSLFLYLKIRPDYIITTGAHIAGPMCCIGKIFGSKIIFIETFANMESKTITGRLVYKFADYFVVQWEDMLKLYPKAVFGGWIY